MIMRALSKKGSALRYVPTEMKTPEICAYAAKCDTDSKTMQYIPWKHRSFVKKELAANKQKAFQEYGMRVEGYAEAKAKQGNRILTKIKNSLEIVRKKIEAKKKEMQGFLRGIVHGRSDTAVLKELNDRELVLTGRQDLVEQFMDLKNLRVVAEKHMRNNGDKVIMFKRDEVVKENVAEKLAQSKMREPQMQTAKLGFSR